MLINILIFIVLPLYSTLIGTIGCSVLLYCQVDLGGIDISNATLAGFIGCIFLIVPVLFGGFCLFQVPLIPFIISSIWSSVMKRVQWIYVKLTENWSHSQPYGSRGDDPEINIEFQIPPGRWLIYSLVNTSPVYYRFVLLQWAVATSSLSSSRFLIHCYFVKYDNSHYYNHSPFFLPNHHSHHWQTLVLSTTFFLIVSTTLGSAKVLKSPNWSPAPATNLRMPVIRRMKKRFLCKSEFDSDMQSAKRTSSLGNTFMHNQIN
jgi:hypothetical protein